MNGVLFGKIMARVFKKIYESSILFSVSIIYKFFRMEILHSRSRV